MRIIAAVILAISLAACGAGAECTLIGAEVNAPGFSAGSCTAQVRCDDGVHWITSWVSDGSRRFNCDGPGGDTWDEVSTTPDPCTTDFPTMLEDRMYRCGVDY